MGGWAEDRLGFEAAAAAPAALYGAARAGRRSYGQRPWSAGQYAGLYKYGRIFVVFVVIVAV